MDEVIKWLFEGDASVRWQVMRDLAGTPKKDWQMEREKVACNGWGKELLSKQDADGLWCGMTYNPKWISGTYTMLVLRRLGLEQGNKQGVLGARVLLDRGLYKDGGINFFVTAKNSETCVTGLVLSVCSYFDIDDERISLVAEHLLGQQMSDGGWNCQSYKGATHSSFHTTINVLEGLREYEKRYDCKRCREAQLAGIEFMLEHRLYKSDKTGETVDERMTKLSFPPRYRYDILRFLDYLQEAKMSYDDRMADAIEVLRARQRKDGKWPLQCKHPGKTFFELEKVGQPSRVNTLRALRVLKWFGVGN